MKTIILEMRSEVKVTMIHKRFMTLRHPKIQMHTKFRIPTRYVPDTMRILEKRSEVKVTVTEK